MEDYKITKKDLFHIVSCAKSNMQRISMPVYVSGKEIEQGDAVSLAVLESVLSFLNSKKLLTTLINVEYTDPSCDHDSE